jgi:nucleoside-diphosphate-sugar epimerase
MHLLVTGATGYVGARTAAALRRAGHTVSGLTRDPGSPAARALAAQEVEVVRGDIANPAGFADALQRADAVVHLTLDLRDPVGSDRALFAALRSAQERDGRRRHLVYTTGCSSYGRTDATVLDEDSPGNPDGFLYFRFALEAELAASGLPFTVLRPGFVYGGPASTSMTARWFAEGRTPAAVFAGDRTKRWTWVHVDDLADAYVRVVDDLDTADGEVFCVGEEEPAAAHDVFTACLAAAGGGATPTYLPVEQAGPMDQAADQDEIMTSAKARRILGWEPVHAGVLAEIGTYHDAWATGV